MGVWWWDEGTGGRQVSRMQSGETGESVAGEKKLILIILQSPPLKIHFDLLKTKPQRKKKKPKM